MLTIITGMRILKYILLFAIAQSTIIGCSQNNSTETTNMRKRKIQDNPYTDLRSQAINVTAEQLQINPSENELFGIVMDWNMGDAIVTVSAFSTGDASVYMSTGQAFIGGSSHESVINAAKQFIKKGIGYLPNAVKTDKTDTAPPNKIRFYFLTKDGRSYMETDMKSIEDGHSDLLELFEAANVVITEYRMIAG